VSEDDSFGGQKLGDRDAALAEIFALRVELLYAAVWYGACCAIEEGRDEFAEWLGWLDWVAAVVSDLARTAGHRADESDLVPGWLRTAIDTLERAADGEPDEFDAAEFRGLARVAGERIAERARPIERRSGEPMGEIGGQPSRAWMRLLGLIQDSLILVATGSETNHLKRADARSVADHVTVARDAGVWDVLTP
jgi:hypothetical protein